MIRESKASESDICVTMEHASGSRMQRSAERVTALLRLATATRPTAEATAAYKMAQAIYHRQDGPVWRELRYEDAIGCNEHAVSWRGSDLPIVAVADRRCSVSPVSSARKRGYHTANVCQV